MSKVTKTTALFFAAMIFFVSISTQNYALLLTSDLRAIGSENSVSYFSAPDKIPLFLNRQQEKLVTSAKDLPVYGSKINLTDLYTNRLSNELRLLNINSDYLSFSVIDYRNFTNSEIVFPFHSFW
jgi:hypothetical protein